MPLGFALISPQALEDRSAPHCIVLKNTKKKQRNAHPHLYIYLFSVSAIGLVSGKATFVFKLKLVFSKEIHFFNAIKMIFYN